MTTATIDNQPLPAYCANSVLFRELLAERDEVEKHKWYESERAGEDIGFCRALLDWRIKHGAEWIKRRPERVQQINLHKGEKFVKKQKA